MEYRKTYPGFTINEFEEQLYTYLRKYKCRVKSITIPEDIYNSLEDVLKNRYFDHDGIKIIIFNGYHGSVTILKSSQ